MAYMRGQYNVPYNSHFTQRGSSKSHSTGSLPTVQPQVNQFSGTYSWGSTTDQAGNTTWVRSYEEVDYRNYESAETQPQEGYEQNEPAGYEEGYGSLWQGRGGGGERQFQEEGRDKSGAQWQGEDGSGLHRQGQGRGGLRGVVGKYGPGQRRGTFRGNADTYGPGQGRGKSGTRLMYQGSEDTELHWGNEGRDDGGFQWQDEGEEQGETQWLQEVDQSGLHKRSNGRDDGGFQWQDESEEQGETQWLHQGVDNGGLQWHDQRRDDSGFQWPGGRENSGSLWRDQGNITGFGRLRGSRKHVGPGTSAVDRIDVTRGAPGFEDDSYPDRNVDVRGEFGQKGAYPSSGVVKYFGSSTDSGGIGRGGYPDIGRGGGGRGIRGMARGVNIEESWFGRGGRGVVRGMNIEAGRGGQGGRGMARGVNCEVGYSSSRGGGGRGGWGLGRGDGRGRPFQSSSSVAGNNTTGQSSAEESGDKHPEGSLPRLIQKWMTFTKKFVDCGNAISNVECSLTSSKVHALTLDFDCKFLAKCGNYSVFTGVLKIIKQSHSKGIPEESVFLARSQGLNKKSAKLSCYEAAYKVLLNSSVEEIMQQKDVDEKNLRQQVQLNYCNNPDEFMETLKGVTSSSAASQQPQEDKKEAASKRSSSASAVVPAAKKPRNTDFAPEVVLNKQLSLVPTKKLDVLMNPADPLVEKLEMLKKLLKEEGITKLHIVPKIDQLAYKCAILIQNVYRVEDVARSAFEMGTEIYCEIYCDDVYMTRGPTHNEKHIATQQAYSNLAGQLYSRPLNVLANNPRMWTPFMALALDVHHVVTKWHGKDNDSLLTNNLSNMKQMMQSGPDVTIPIEQMVLTQHESDKSVDNMFKYLELSATRNLMLLECEIMRNPDLTFTCTLSLQGKILASCVHPTKNSAKRLCSEVVMTRLKETQDIIYVKTLMVGTKITKKDLLLSAMKKKALGEPPGKIFKRFDYEEVWEEKQDNRENLPENVKARPLYPWIAAAVYEILDEYYQKITLEDLLLDLADMPKSQRDIISSCAAKMGLRLVTKTKHSFNGPLLRRTVTAQEMSKILQLQGGESGRYKLMSCKNPLSPEELQKFRNQCLAAHRKLVEARTHDTPDEDPGRVPDVESQLVASGSSDNKLSTFTRPQHKPSTSNHQQQARDISTGPLSHRMPRAPHSSAYRPRFEPRIPAPLFSPPMPHMMPGFRPMMDPHMFRNPFHRY